MTPEARRVLIPLFVSGLALLVVLAYLSPRFFSTAPEQPAEEETVSEQVTDPEDHGAVDVPTADEVAQDAPPIELPDAPLTEAPDDLPRISLNGLRAVSPSEGITDREITPASLGDLDPRRAPMLIEFVREGAGIKRITSSEQWLTAAARRRADAHYRARDAGDVSPPPLPDDEFRYVLKKAQPLGTWMIPVLSSHFMLVEDQRVWVFDVSRDAEGNIVLDVDGNRVPVWAETEPGRFETIIINEHDEPVLRVSRAYTFGQNGDITLRQRIVNLTAESIELEWRQYGPSDLEMDRSRYIDRRRFRFGYLLSPERDPSRADVRADDNSLVLERRTVLNRFDDPTHIHLWPNRTSKEKDYELSWFAAQNRYFALAVHPALDEQGRGNRSLTNVVEEIRYLPSDSDRDRAVVFTYLHSPLHTIEPGQTLSLDLGVYAGPMDRLILNEQPYGSLAMNQLILYQMSTWCAICTFQWLAHILLAILSFLHDYMLFDWGLSIIALVILVRLLLHPITKKSQINMMRFGKQMQKLKPEIDRLQKKYKDGTKESAKKMQQEQLKLFREHGINPFQMLGCLPMFLQIPIWIALYAMLYFAIEIRHEAAFFGAFQLFWNWPFLGDLSSGDHFFGEFEEPKFFFGFWNVTGLNILPILMGIVLFIHQKYMTPPTTATMSPEQQQQQKIMRVMMVTMLPIFLYNAPSGLTLYILTSSCIGIIESRYIRRHVDQLDLEPKKKVEDVPAWAKKKKKKPRDPQARAFGDAVDRAKAKRSKGKGDKPKTFKKKRK